MLQVSRLLYAFVVQLWSRLFFSKLVFTRTHVLVQNAMSRA